MAKIEDYAIMKIYSLQNLILLNCAITQSANLCIREMVDVIFSTIADLDTFTPTAITTPMETNGGIFSNSNSGWMSSINPSRGMGTAMTFFS